MGRKKRSDVFDPDEVGIYHCIQRAVRRAWLCGEDGLTGRSFEHRRVWLQEQLQELSSIYAFDYLSYAILSNHLHVVVRNRPDILRSWSNREVAMRWWQLCPGKRDGSGKAARPSERALRPLLAKKRNRELRKRLGCISWMMRYLAEPIARRANKEDNCTGHFWEGRFKCQKLVDEPAVLACSAYVDLNPVRAGIAATTEESLFTSAYARLAALAGQMAKIGDTQSATETPCSEEHTTAEITAEEVTSENGTQEEVNVNMQPDAWLAPVELDERAEAYTGTMPSSSGYRASDKGFLPMSTQAYLELLQWTAREVRTRSGEQSQRNSGVIPKGLTPLMERLGLDAGSWCDLVGRFGKIFKQAAGRPVALAQEASRRKQRWLQTCRSPLADLAT